MPDLPAIPPEDPQAPAQHDYFGQAKPVRYMFPDGISWVDFKVMKDGDRQALISGDDREVTIKKRSGDMTTKLGLTADRSKLFAIAFVGWNIIRGNEGVLPFNDKNVSLFAASMDVEINDAIEKAIQGANPWLKPEMSIEDIDLEIKSLQEQREEVLKTEAGKASS